MPTDPHYDHPLLEQSLSDFAAFTAAAERSDLEEAVAPLAARYRLGLYRLVLVGEEKRGKSSLISALLGAPNLLPAGPEPMTACIFKVIYGPALQYRVFFLPDPEHPDSLRPEPLDVSAAEAEDYGTEQGNPDNRRRVDFIAVEHPHPLLKAGLTIVDLPGLGGLKIEHALLTFSYLSNADAAFFVVDSVSGAMTREELETLDRLHEFTRHVLFVQTKIDAVSSAQWQAWRDRNLEQITSRVGLGADEIPYFAVSSVLKRNFDEGGDDEDLIDSGYSPLIDRLTTDLIPRKQDRVAEPMVAALVAAVTDAARPIETEIAILATSSEAELARIEAELRQASADYNKWKSTALLRVLSSFRDDFRAAEIDADRAIALDLDPSERGPIVGPLLAEIETDTRLSARAIADQCARLNGAAVLEAGARLDQIAAAFDARTLAAFDRAAGAIAEAIPPLVLGDAMLRIELPFERISLRSHTSLWSTLMQGRMGLMTGAMAAGMAASLFFPPVSLVVFAVTALGGLLGANRSIQDARTRERAQAESQMRQLLMDTVRRLQHHGAREFRIAADDKRKVMLATLAEAVAQRDRDEKGALAAIGERRRQTREQTAAHMARLERRLDLATVVLDRLRAAGARFVEDEVSAAA